MQGMYFFFTITVQVSYVEYTNPHFITQLQLYKILYTQKNNNLDVISCNRTTASTRHFPFRISVL